MTDLISASFGPTGLSIRDLARPINAHGSAPRSDSYRKTLEALAFAVEHGDEETSAAAEMLAYRLICDVMAARLLEPDRGPISRLIDRIHKSVRSFEEILR